MNTRNRSSASNRFSMISISLALLLALAPAAIAQTQQDPPTGAGRRGPATRPAGGFGGGGFGGGGGFSGGGTVAGERGGRGMGGMSAARTPVLGEGPACTFDATIYDVRMAADQIGRLDVVALSGASGSAEAFEKALGALGTAKPMYRADQSVRLSGDTISIGAQVPYVTSSSMTAGGQTMHSITYVHTGAIFSLAGKTDANNVDMDLTIEVSSMLESAVTTGGDAKSPIMHTATLSHKGPVTPRKSFIVVTVDAGSLDKDGKAVAYIGRVTVGEPQAPAPR